MFNGQRSVAAPSLVMPAVGDGYAVLWHLLRQAGTPWGVKACHPIAAAVSTHTGFHFPVSSADFAMQWVQRSQTYAMVRVEDDYLDPDHYRMYISEGLGAANENHLRKRVAGVETDLGSEGADLGGSPQQWLAMISVGGTTIKDFRTDMVTAKFSATDSALAGPARGGFGGEDGFFDVHAYGAYVLAAQSVVPRPQYFAELPVVGSGDFDDPFRPGFDGVLLPGVCWSAVIKTGKDGKPVDYRAIVRLFDTDATRAKAAAWLDACRAKAGFIEMDAETAIDEALTLDDALTVEAFTDDDAQHMKGWTP